MAQATLTPAQHRRRLPDLVFQMGLPLALLLVVLFFAWSSPAFLVPSFVVLHIAALLQPRHLLDLVQAFGQFDKCAPRIGDEGDGDVELRHLSHVHGLDPHRFHFLEEFSEVVNLESDVIHDTPLSTHNGARRGRESERQARQCS